jgi:DNA-binding MarR family transcriptional regulator
MSAREEFERATWDGLRELVLERYARRREVSEALGMSFLKTRALRRLLPGPLSMRDLAAALSTDAPYTTLLLDHLESRGLVIREPHPEDRRAKLVSLTADGTAAAQRAERIHQEPPAVLHELDDADLAALHRIISKLTAPATAPTGPGSGAATDPVRPAEQR